ncbi:radical SAM protein [Iocasia frigidifontis]|uniref:Radical SAM protein n=1 Tax=Iocasia fonsfrigidae TaxID=2682810 RepID=A0A8A7KIL2_9FIRM|nr:radical SAM protein [Iocasia fonsfrigidae]QTL97712.1 radical SAM protein [Iocasia fonsfrigidae]
MRILLVVYDNDSYIHWFPQGIAYIASVLKIRGYEIVIYNQDYYHYPDEHLTEYLNNNYFDVIGVGIIAGYYQYRKLLRISEAINNSKNRPIYILGGHGPSPEPEYFMKKTQADYVVIGEGEETMVELLETVGNKKDLSQVKGIAYRDGSDIIVTERRPLIKDLDTLPIPAYELFPIEYYRLIRPPHSSRTDFVMPVLSGRGCLFNCNFCYRMDKGFRPRSNESIINEIKYLQKEYRINYIIFSDELLMSSVRRVESLCNDFLKNNLNIKWSCNGRLNFAKKDVLKLMKKSGCVFINYGIEAMDDQILKNMNKVLTTKQIVEGIEATLAVGISPGYNIIFGNIGENRETLNKGVEFLLKYDDCTQFRTIRPVTPYPGSPLYYYAIEKGLLRDVEDFYEYKHVNSDLLAVNFTELTDDEFHKALLEANKKLMTNYYNKKFEFSLQQAKDLYIKKDVSFRGFRQI